LGERLSLVLVDDPHLKELKLPLVSKKEWMRNKKIRQDTSKQVL